MPTKQPKIGELALALAQRDYVAVVDRLRSNQYEIITTLDLNVQAMAFQNWPMMLAMVPAILPTVYWVILEQSQAQTQEATTDDVGPSACPDPDRDPDI